MKKILIVGAGASGLMAAIHAKGQNTSVTILEANAQTAKKILATGNGHCNFLNEDQNRSHFHSSQVEKMNVLLNEVTKEEILADFSKMGILPREKNGYLYPMSNQASSIRSALLMAAKNKKAVIETEENVLSAVRRGRRFLVKTEKKTYECDRLILACGSRAGIREKDYHGGLMLAKEFGLSCKDFLPALVQMISDEKICAYWSGVRRDALISLVSDGSVLQTENGELMLTDYGISGIPVFQLSGKANQLLKQKKKVFFLIDFVPLLTKEELDQFLADFSKQGCSMKDVLTGILPDKLAQSLVMEAMKRNRELFEKRADQYTYLSLNKEQKEVLLSGMKNFVFHVTGSKGFEMAQVCSGGVDLSEIDEKTCESKKIPGLYITGEMLDVNGDCGGYNLQWAWTTGMLAGKAAGREDEK